MAVPVGLWLAAACAVAADRTATADVPPPAAAMAADPAADTDRLVQAALARRLQSSADDRQAAQRLLREGDRAYRQRAYGAAYKAYSSAYPNHPSAYAYLMSGDARWRAMLQAKGHAPPDAQGCRLANTHFAHDLSQDLAQHHQVGLALTAAAPAPDSAGGPADRPVSTFMQRRARASAACLQGVADDHGRRAAATCVDLGAVRRCLGAPLRR